VIISIRLHLTFRNITTSVCRPQMLRLGADVPLVPLVERLLTPDMINKVSGELDEVVTTAFLLIIPPFETII